MSESPAVHIAGLTVSYGATRAVAGLDLQIGAGRITAVLGPNGAGKTTTIEVCEGLRRPDAGVVRVLGLAPTDPGLRPRVGVMLQDGGGYSGARPLELLTHFARLYRSPHDPRTLLSVLGQTGTATYRRLSGGERARLLLAVALIGRPELVFLDEPSSGLDVSGRETLWTLVRELRGQGTTVVLTTHSFEEAEALADDVAIMASGQVRASGPLELLAPRDRLVVRFTCQPGLVPSALAAEFRAGETLTEVRAGEYRVSGGVGPDTLAAIAAWGARNGVAVSDLGLGNPGLADLYRRLTDA